VIKKKFGLVNAGYRQLSVDRIRQGFYSFFENEIHEEDQEQDDDDQ
jgi:hypothetical protein